MMAVVALILNDPACWSVGWQRLPQIHTNMGKDSRPGLTRRRPIN
jgi:hypothetical protein